jgi:type IV secretory pathway VirD2 relaxase
MIPRDDDRPIRIRPGKPPVARHEGAVWAGAYRLVMHYARSMRKPGKGTGSARIVTKPHHQRCAVRVTYLNNRTRGQWKAHGRYLARESAAAGKPDELGFNRDSSGVDVAYELERWQSSGDARLWKVILSPEFGDRIDLHRFTRDLVGRMAKNLGTDLEWIAVAHHNTEHPHVHMVIRGVRDNGQPLQFRPEFLKHGIRGLAEDLCTRQIGYRTSQDAIEAERREIGEKRFTSLDRAILRDTHESGHDANPASFTLRRNPEDAELPESARLHLKHILARLAVLQRMGIVQVAAPNTWHVRRDLEQVLRAMQRTADRQRTLAAHGVPISDDRLPNEVLDIHRFTAVEGRILVHGQDEQSGHNYLMLEGTDARVHFIQYTPEMELLRRSGGLRANSFIRLRKLLVRGETTLDVHDLGDAEQVLQNRHLLAEKAGALLKRGISPAQDGWGGWLGRYQAALARVANELRLDRERWFSKSLERRRDLSLGR